jgi:Fe2+ transport system protein FeoA
MTSAVTPDHLTPVPLTALAAGASARLHDTGLDEDTRSLLRSLGLTDDSQLRVCKCGDPFIIQVRTTRIGVSGAVARRIRVVRDDGSQPDGSHAGHRSQN